MASLAAVDVDGLIFLHGRRADIGAHLQEMLRQFDTRQPLMAQHVRFVGIYAYLAARELALNPIGALFMAVGHDAGKLMLPDDLFSGRNLTSRDEFENIKRHARLGYEYWKKHHLMCAIAAGAHHALYEGGYGIDLVHEAPEWVQRSQYLLDLIVLISMVDYSEAYLHRRTKQFNPVGDFPLEEQLALKYANWDKDRIRTVVRIIQAAG